MATRSSLLTEIEARRKSLIPERIHTQLQKWKSLPSYTEVSPTNQELKLFHSKEARLSFKGLAECMRLISWDAPIILSMTLIAQRLGRTNDLPYDGAFYVSMLLNPRCRDMSWSDWSPYPYAFNGVIYALSFMGLGLKLYVIKFFNTILTFLILKKCSSMLFGEQSNTTNSRHVGRKLAALMAVTCLATNPKFLGCAAASTPDPISCLACIIIMSEKDAIKMAFWNIVLVLSTFYGFVFVISWNMSVLITNHFSGSMRARRPFLNVCLIILALSIPTIEWNAVGRGKLMRGHYWDAFENKALVGKLSFYLQCQNQFLLPETSALAFGTPWLETLFLLAALIVIPFKSRLDEFLIILNVTLQFIVLLIINYIFHISFVEFYFSFSAISYFGLLGVRTREPSGALKFMLCAACAILIANNLVAGQSLKDISKENNFNLIYEHVRSMSRDGRTAIVVSDPRLYVCLVNNSAGETESRMACFVDKNLLDLRPGYFQCISGASQLTQLDFDKIQEDRLILISMGAYGQLRPIVNGYTQEDTKIFINESTTVYNVIVETFRRKADRNTLPPL